MKPLNKKLPITKSHLFLGALFCVVGVLVTLNFSHLNGLLQANLMGTSGNTTVTIETSLGSVDVELFEREAPKTVKNFTGLAEEGKYDHTMIHEVNPKMYVQMGDYEFGDGSGGKSLWNNTFADEISWQVKPLKGTIGMANMGPDTNGSQFFILLDDAPHLSGRHTFFGRIADAENNEVLEAFMEVAVNHQGVPKEALKIDTITVN